MLHRSYVPLEFASWTHDFMPTAEAAELEVHARAQDKPSFLAAGMDLFHCKNVVNSYIHSGTSV